MNQFEYHADNLERLIGLFGRVNAIKPPPSPEGIESHPITAIVISKGFMRIETVAGSMAVDVPLHEQVDHTAYLNLVGLLAKQLAGFAGIMEYSQQIKELLGRDGLTLRFQGGVWIINPLKLQSRESQW